MARFLLSPLHSVILIKLHDPKGTRKNILHEQKQNKEISCEALTMATAVDCDWLLFTAPKIVTFARKVSCSQTLLLSYMTDV